VDAIICVQACEGANSICTIDLLDGFPIHFKLEEWIIGMGFLQLLHRLFVRGRAAFFAIDRRVDPLLREVGKDLRRGVGVEGELPEIP